MIIQKKIINNIMTVLRMKIPVVRLKSLVIMTKNKQRIIRKRDCDST